MLDSLAVAARAVGGWRNRWQQRLWLPLVVIGLALAGGAWARGGRGGAAPRLLAGIEFRDQTGSPFRFEQLAGSTLLVNFIFTRCAAVCPTQTRQLAELHRAMTNTLRGDVRFVSISLDPEHDAAAELARFARENGADVPGWSFVATSPERTRALVAQLQGASPEALTEAAASRQVTPELRHETALYLFDRSGRLLQRYVGAPIDRARLLTELQRAVRVGAAP